MRINNQKNKNKKNNIIKEEQKEIKSLNWFDKNKFKEILAIIYSNEFNYKNKTGGFKYIYIRDLVNYMRNYTISEIDVKKCLNKLNKIKNVQTIKYKKGTSGNKKLLNLFNDLLDVLLTDKTLKPESQEYKNENENVNGKNEDEYENEDDDDETMSQDKKSKIIKD